jgi:hypothetical protein
VIALLRILSSCVLLLLADPLAVNAQETPSPNASTGGLTPASPAEAWGHERLAWDQPNPDAASLADLTFTAYIDGLIDVLEDVRCSSAPNAAGDFECSSRFPRMVPGAHVVELTATNGANTVSVRSAPLHVILRERTTQMASSATARSAGLDAEQIVGALVDATDIAALPDGTLIIGERSGRILSTRPGQTATTAFDLRALAQPGAQLELLALAAASDFAETRAVFAAYVWQSGLRVARFTEANGILSNHAILREGLPINPSAPGAALAVGPDSKIYVAVNDQVFRLNADGSTPADGSASGVFSAGPQQPGKLAWNIDQQVMWLLGSTPNGSELRSIALGERGQGTMLSSYSLGPLSVTSLAILPESSDGGSRLIVTPRDSTDLLQWRASKGDLDQATWVTSMRPADATAMVQQNGGLWIASRSGLFRVDLSRR